MFDTHTQYPYEHYLSVRQAGTLFGYSSDYLARLARERKIIGVRVSGRWLVDPQSVADFSSRAAAKKAQHNARTRGVQRQERAQKVDQRLAQTIPVVTVWLLDDMQLRARALIQTGGLIGAGIMCAVLVQGDVLKSMTQLFASTGAEVYAVSDVLIHAFSQLIALF